MKSFIIFFSTVVLVSSCTNHQAETAVAAQTKEVKPNADTNLVELSESQAKNAGIQTGDAELREMHSMLRVNGVIDLPPENEVSVSIPLGGYLKKFSLIPGQKVNKGALLATLEDQQYIQLQQDYLTAKSRLVFLQSDFTRQQDLNQTKASSDKVFQQARTDYESQKVLVKALNEKLKLIGISPGSLTEENISRSVNIFSPISGYVSEVNVNIGKYINPADVLCEIVDPNDLHLRLTVFENDAASLILGQKLKFSTNNHPEEKYTAEIHFVTPNIGEDRSTDVHCHIEGKTAKLFPGTFVTAEIELNNARVRAVPDEAVVKWQNSNFVFAVEKPNQYRIVPVTIGASLDGFTEIRSDLAERKLVIKNAYTLLMKMKNSSEE